MFMGDDLPPVDSVTKPTAIVIGQRGISEIRNYYGYQVVRTPTIKLGARIKYLLPWAVFTRIVGLFKEVERRHHTEVVVYVWRNDAGHYEVTVPEQWVSAGRAEPVDETLTPPEGDGWRLFAHIHSHNTMSAFFSGTDNASEQQDGVLFGVVGKINDYIPESKWRVRAMGEWMELSLGDVVAMPRIWNDPPPAWFDGVHVGTRPSKTSSTPPQTTVPGYNPPYSRSGGSNRRPNAAGQVWPIKVIKLDGTVWHEWRNGDCNPTGLRVEEMKPTDRKDAVVEGDDWTPISKSTTEQQEARK